MCRLPDKVNHSETLVQKSSLCTWDIIT